MTTKTAYMVEWGTTDGMAEQSNRIFPNRAEAAAFFNGIDIRHEWIREYDTSSHLRTIARHKDIWTLDVYGDLDDNEFGYIDIIETECYTLDDFNAEQDERERF